MPHYQYLIIGGGMTAAAAVDGIREGRSNRRDRADQRGVGRSVRSSPSLESAVEGHGIGQHLAQDGRAKGSRFISVASSKKFFPSRNVS